jgi:hypothetical protein
MFFQMQLATPADDDDLRSLLRENPFAGAISLSFEREPNYFFASATGGPFSETLIARDSKSNLIIGIGERSVRPLYLNGKVCDIGYLGGLRSNSKYRQGLALARFLGKAFEAQYERHKDGRTPFYLTSIVADNTPALRLLNSGLPKYPRYHPYTRMFTYAIHPARSKREIPLPHNVQFKRGSLDLIPAIVDCLNRNGSRFQFAPYWTKDTLLSDLTPALSISDFFLAVRGERVVGCLALWDQQPFKQSVIRGYSGAIARYRKLINWLSPLGGWPVLPEPGTRLNQCFASFLAIDDDNPEIFSTLLRALYNEAALRKYDYFMLGFAEGHPFLSIAKSYHPIIYKSEIFLVSWEDGYEEVANVDKRPPALEIALL